MANPFSHEPTYIAICNTHLISSEIVFFISGCQLAEAHRKFDLLHQAYSSYIRNAFSSQAAGSEGLESA